MMFDAENCGFQVCLLLPENTKGQIWFLSFCVGGSFRHFLWQAVRELQSPLLPILTVCPSSAVGVNKNRYILVPGAMSYSQERLLHFFGQVSVYYALCSFYHLPLFAVAIVDAKFFLQ